MAKEYVRVRNYVKTGISFGSGLAMVISFTTNRSVIWAIIHGIFSWLYVMYYAIGFGR